MNPTGLEQVREVALAGERMPQKATFFYPKLPTGLVFQDLSGSAVERTTRKSIQGRITMKSRTHRGNGVRGVATPERGA